jgi:hypothetical protein
MNKRFKFHLQAAMAVTDNLVRTLDQMPPTYAKAFNQIAEDFLKSLEEHGLIRDYQRKDGRLVFSYDEKSVEVRYPVVREANPNRNVMGGVQGAMNAFIEKYRDRIKDLDMNDPWAMRDERQSFRDVLNAWQYYAVIQDFSVHKDSLSVTMTDPNFFLNARQLAKLNEGNPDAKPPVNPSCVTFKY